MSWLDAEMKELRKHLCSRSPCSKQRTRLLPLCSPLNCPDRFPRSYQGPHRTHALSCSWHRSLHYLATRCQGRRMANQGRSVHKQSQARPQQPRSTWPNWLVHAVGKWEVCPSSDVAAKHACLIRQASCHSCRLRETRGACNILGKW
jgi:hypothetical protein